MTNTRSLSSDRRSNSLHGSLSETDRQLVCVGVFAFLEAKKHKQSHCFCSYNFRVPVPSPRLRFNVRSFSCPSKNMWNSIQQLDRRRQREREGRQAVKAGERTTQDLIHKQQQQCCRSVPSQQRQQQQLQQQKICALSLSCLLFLSTLARSLTTNERRGQARQRERETRKQDAACTLLE